MISKFLSICSVCEAHVQAHTGTLYCENCVSSYCQNCAGGVGSSGENPRDCEYENTDYEVQEREDQRQFYLDETYSEAQHEVNNILTEEAKSEARAIDAAIEKDQKEELERVEKLNQLSAEQLEHIQELVARETVSLGKETKKKTKKLKKKSKKTSSKEGGPSSSEN
jgi:hypothetical protein